MMLHKRNVIAAALFFIFTGIHAQQVKTNWQVNAFQACSFVENRGQFNELKGKAYSDIRYAVKLQGGYLFFTPSGLSWRYAFSEKAEAEHKRRFFGKSQRTGEEFKTTLHEMRMEWEGANKHPEIIAEAQTPDYYTYGVSKNGQESIRASAFEKLTYKNLYPGIDLVYRFHPEQGIKYHFVVHPGADARQISMRYNGHQAIETDADGNLLITMGAGTVLDHAPLTFYEDKTQNKNNISSSYRILNRNEVQFVIGNYDHAKTIIIDPWQINPAFGGSANNGYDIRHDASGNVYASGGGAPFELKKFTSAGTLIWTFTYNVISMYYGDFCIAPTGEIYIVYGPWGDNMIKVTAAGTQVYQVGSPLGSGRETYRVEYSPVTNKIVVAGMELNPGTVSLIYEVDPATGNQSNHVYLNASYSCELRAMAMEGNGNVYTMSMSGVSSSNSSQDNRIWVVNSAHVTLYDMMSNYNLRETQASYTTTDYSGFNGMAVGCYLYTYDGRKVIKWDKSNGTYMDSVVTPNGNPYNLGGICLDQCGNVYIGTANAVIQYDGNLNLLTTLPMTGDVYDVAIGSNPNELLVTGVGFVASVTANMNCLGGNFILSTTTQPSNGCVCVGTATVSNDTICSNPGPLTYNWLQINQTTDSVSGLCPGTYTCIVTAVNSGIQDTITVVVGGTQGSVTVTAAGTDPTCNGCTDGTATATPVGGTGPYTYLWTPGGYTTQNVSGLGAGTYTVLITDAQGCTDTTVITLNEPPLPPPLSGLTVPNVFSPNGDQNNDLFMLTQYGIAKITWQIYDRWGVLVFESNDPAIGWDGKNTKGKPCTDGTYYYVIDGLGVDDTVYKLSGFLTLIR